MNYKEFIENQFENYDKDLLLNYLDKLNDNEFSEAIIYLIESDTKEAYKVHQISDDVYYRFNNRITELKDNINNCALKNRRME
jgi:hypothetical protein